jgi:hypothetical protein
MYRICPIRIEIIYGRGKVDGDFNTLFTIATVIKHLDDIEIDLKNRYFGPLSHNFRLGGWVRPYIPPYMMASIGGHHTTASPVLNTFTIIRCFCIDQFRQISSGLVTTQWSMFPLLLFK